MAFNRILEYTSLGGATAVGGVDRAKGVISGVKILGSTSANGRIYPEATISKAVTLYEAVKVNVDHGVQPNKPRSYSDRIGLLRNVKVRDGGLYGDFHANPKHPLFEQLAWDAENSPESVGFSHNILGRTSQRGGQTVVEEISKVTSVDLVADPATTKGLFESTAAPAPKPHEKVYTPQRKLSREDFVRGLRGVPTLAESEEFTADLCRSQFDDSLPAPVAEAGKVYPKITSAQFLAEIKEMK